MSIFSLSPIFNSVQIKVEAFSNVENAKQVLDQAKAGEIGNCCLINSESVCCVYIVVFWFLFVFLKKNLIDL